MVQILRRSTAPVGESRTYWQCELQGLSEVRDEDEPEAVLNATDLRICQAGIEAFENVTARAEHLGCCSKISGVDHSIPLPSLTSTWTVSYVCS